MSRTVDAVFGGTGPAYGSLGTFHPAHSDGNRKHRQSVARVVAGAALCAAVVCIVLASSAAPAGRSVAMPAGAPSRRSSLSYKREMILASREAGFDLTKLASERTTVLESSISNTQLCIKRDTILDLFNELLKRLMDEQETELALYNSYVQEKTDAHTAYVEAEAAFATAEKQHNDATKEKDLAVSASLAATTVYEQSKKSYDENVAPYETELEGIVKDMELMKQLLSMIETLHNEPQGSTMWSNTQARLKQHVVQIQKLALKIKSKQAHALAAKLPTQSLAEYEESSSVKGIILALMQDILDRKAFIENEVKEYKTAMDEADQIRIERDGLLADASKAEEVAATELAKWGSAMRASLKASYETADGKVSMQTTVREKSDVQFERERFVISQIMQKLNAYCDETEDTSLEVAHMSCVDPDNMIRFMDVCTCKAGTSGPDKTGPCEVCPEDYYCFGASKGQCVEGAELVSDRSKCICSKGYTGPDNVGPCKKCAANDLCPGGDFEPNTCPYGKSPNDDHTACIFKPGFMKAENDNAEEPAIKCNDNQVCLGGAEGVGITCSENAEPNADRTACVCNPGFTGPNNGACAACPSGSKCVGGEAAPEACASNAIPTSPVPDACACKAGFRGADGENCEPCPDGHYCIGGDNMDSCPSGSTQVDGGHECRCNPGFFGDGRTCERCFPGHKCLGGMEQPVRCDAGGHFEANGARTECVCSYFFKAVGGSCKYKAIADYGNNPPECNAVNTNEPYMSLKEHSFMAFTGWTQNLYRGEWYTDNQNCYQVQPGTFQCRISNCAWKQDQMTDAVSHHGARAQFFNGDRFNSYQTVWVNDFYAPDVKMYTHHSTEVKKCNSWCLWSCSMCDFPKSEDINWDERANSVKIA